ncbi:MAG: transposase [Balneolaceae bacterium]
MKKRPQFYSDAFKLGVIAQVTSGAMSKEQARIHYGIKGNTAILNWMRAFGYVDQTPTLTPMRNKTSKESNNDPVELRIQLKHTQKLLEHEKMRSEFYQIMIDIAEREHGIPIRKKSDTKP